jgi:hypothetical protein
MLTITLPGTTALTSDVGGHAGFALDANIDSIRPLPRGFDERGDQSSILTDIQRCYPILLQAEAGIIQDIGFEKHVKIFQGIAHGPGILVEIPGYLYHI